MAAITATTSPPGKSAARLWRLGIVMAVLVAFGRASAAEFVEWDDPGNLYANALLNPPTAAGVAHYWAHAAYGLYIPLTYTVWGVLAALTNGAPDAKGIAMNPWVFHGVNVLLHVAGALAVFALLTLLVARPAAGAGALVWALHPVQVEAVAWAAGMKDVLSGLLVLVSLWLYVEFARPRQGEVTAPRSARTYYALALIAFVLAMLAKPSAMVAPALALVIDVWLLRRPMRSIAAALAPWFVLSLLCAMVARLAQVTDFDPAPLWARPLIAGDALAFYLYKLIWPASLGIDYGRRPDVIMAHWWFYAAWIIPTAIGVLLWLNRRRAPELFAAGAIFLLALSPVLGLVPFQFQYLSTVTDHYAYVAMLGPALAAGWLIEGAMRRFAPRPVLAASAVVLAALGVRSLLQTGVWRDDLSLFSNAVAVNPRSTVCLTSLGRTYLTRGELAEAEKQFVQALTVDPDSWFARENLALLFELQGNFAAAVEEHKLSLSTMQRRPRNLDRDQMSITAAAVARDLAILGRLPEARVYLDLAREYGADDAIVQAVAEEIQRRSTGASTRPMGLP